MVMSSSDVDERRVKGVDEERWWLTELVSIGGVEENVLK